MWTPQQKVQSVFWLTEFISVTCAQRRVRTEWNVVTDLPQRRVRTEWNVVTDLPYQDSYKMNHPHDQQCLLPRKLTDTSQFEIPKFPSSLKFFPIGG
ncbi:hypothetical protein TNCV_3785861 [Trichonephila clavipes]|nr:hypothetical protein TNCV_3785861 [Trichonephila clavipes]